MKPDSLRKLYFLEFTLIILLLSGAFYLQIYEGEIPCPLCILQRFSLIFLGILFFFGFVIPFKKTGQIIFSLFTSLIACTGILLSGRQVFLQHLPPNQHGDCGASLQYLVQVLPWDQVVKKIFQGSAECSATGWQFLHLSLAEWSLLWFIFFLLISLFQLCNIIRSK